MNRIEDNRIPMVIVPMPVIEAPKPDIRDLGAKPQSGVVILENPIEIKSHIRSERGAYIDFYA